MVSLGSQIFIAKILRLHPTEWKLFQECIWLSATEIRLLCMYCYNPMGSLTTPSAVIVPGLKVMTWDDWVSQKIVVVRRTRRKEVVPEGQMGFGI